MHLLTLTLTVASCGVAVLGEPAPPRDTIPFDYAWRFALAPGSAPAPPAPPPPPPPSPQPYPDCTKFNTTNAATCSGLHATASGDASAAACKAACCKEGGCTVYQYTEHPSPSCWTGTCLTPLRGPTAGWVSGSVPTGPLPPQPTPPAPPSKGCGAECAVGFPDDGWGLVDVPHDYIIPLPITNATVPRTKYPGEANGFFPRVDGIYRKHFALPLEWQGDHVYIKFEGVYRVAYVYVNGVLVVQYGGGSDGTSAAAYTDFEVRLDNLASVTYGPTTPNLVAVYVDGSYGHEHWYAGAGLYRSVHLVRTSKMHIDAGSLYFVATPDTSRITSRSSSSSSAAGGVAVSELSAPATIKSTVTVVNDGAAERSVAVHVLVLDRNDVAVASTTTTVAGVPPGGGIAVAIPPVRQIANASLWTVQTPHLYNVVCSIADAQTGQVLDSVNTTIGVRSATWKVDTGFYLNGENVKIRGFCNHDDFTAVGMAVPDRIWLLRAMQNRGVGANAWRTSHNNYRASVYDIADATGTLVYDENRDLRASALGAMAKMVKAHRNHPAIIAYSLCNEGECNWGRNPAGKTPGTSWKHNRTIFGMFHNITKELDPTRALSANMWSEYGPGSLTDFLDVQGISHAGLAELQQIEQLAQKRPLIASECCSCQSERGFDHGTLQPAGFPYNGTAGKNYPSFNGDCLQQQVNLTDSMPSVAGSMIWTFGDYIGESLAWPSVSSSFGAVDLAGFPKAGAQWFAAWWLNSESPLSVASRPPLPKGVTLHIVESNEPRQQSSDNGISNSNSNSNSTAGSSNATFHVYSSADTVELLVNGRTLGEKSNAEWMGWTEWNTSWVAGNVTAIARGARGGEAIATHSRVTAGAAVAIVLQLDAPSETTATGQKVVLDGHDVALVRATVVDARGVTVPSAAANITFDIVSGPGRVFGVGNGDPQCRLPHQVNWRPAFRGLSRAVVKVTVDGSRTGRTLGLIRSIDVESGKSTIHVQDPASAGSNDPIVIQASAPGLGSATLSIPVSTSTLVDGVLASARASLTSAVSLE